MKLFIIALVSFALIGTIAAQDDACFKNIDEVSCKSGAEPANCHAMYGGIANAKGELQDYVNRQLAASFDYLRLATFFNSFQRDRPGFSKLFRSLSDRSFDDSIKLIKQITKRGVNHDIKYHQEAVNTASQTAVSWEVDELYALSRALDKEKQLSQKAIDIHSHVSKLHTSPVIYDPEISQFLEEEFLSKQSETVRKLSGYANDLWKIVKDTQTKTAALGIYLFDQYLQKQ